MQGDFTPGGGQYYYLLHSFLSILLLEEVDVGRSRVAQWRVSDFGAQALQGVSPPFLCWHCMFCCATFHRPMCYKTAVCLHTRFARPTASAAAPAQGLLPALAASALGPASNSVKADVVATAAYHQHSHTARACGWLSSCKSLMVQC